MTSDSSQSLSQEEIREELEDLDNTELQFLLDSCKAGSSDTLDPENYFTGLRDQRAGVVDKLLKEYPEAAKQFVETRRLSFQQGKISKSGIVDELSDHGYNQELLAEPRYDSFDRLLLIAFDIFYNPESGTLSPQFKLMTGRAQIKHERTEARYKFDTDVDPDLEDSDAFSKKVDEFERQRNEAGNSVAVWSGTMDEDAAWVKLFGKRPPKTEYVIEETGNVTPEVETRSRHPVKTLAAKIQRMDDGLVVHTYDNIDGSGLKKVFRSFLETVTTGSSSEFEEFEPVESPNAKSLVSTAREQAEKAADSEPDEFEGWEAVQEQMDAMTEDLLEDLDELDAEIDTEVIQQQLDEPPEFVGFEISHDEEETSIEQFSIRFSDSFQDVRGQFEGFDDTAYSLVRQADRDNIELLFRVPNPERGSPDVFAVNCRDWSDIRGVSRETYETIELLIGETYE